MDMYQALLAQKSQVEKDLKIYKLTQKSELINKILETMKAEGISKKDLSAASLRNITMSNRPRYRNTESNAFWSGRGRPPQWFRDGKYELLPALLPAEAPVVTAKSDGSYDYDQEPKAVVDETPTEVKKEPVEAVESTKQAEHVPF